METGMRLRDRLIWIMPKWFHRAWARLTGWQLQAQIDIKTGELIGLMWIPVEPEGGMPQEIEIPEKLTEEIAETMFAEVDTWTRLTARAAITRIAQAIARGEMELPGEVGRYVVAGAVRPIGAGEEMQPWLNNMAHRGATMLIAFRPSQVKEEK